ncbi:DUF2802 domain-containing protein [Gilvimarinus algae]|uniref:DUF2802 domain-containing protein n=1 Tax=Gilvimarinus algae TaxID=3058037 RepID=A0ABT8TF55_9GAMM|nr:DUF2802 domain-containing protein [Gilvimarinus sp. SDUM040014]MDO3382566.1 DUF2802 domain-containing protein [Gilvimarinus sp. SDUM040014]
MSTMEWLSDPRVAPLALLVALVALLAALLALGQRKALVALRSEQGRLKKELALLHSGAVGMGQRILAMEQRTQADPGLADDGDMSRPYSEATHLLSLGLDRDEVASRCGLSRAEASLLDALRKKPTA